MRLSYRALTAIFAAFLAFFAALDLVGAQDSTLTVERELIDDSVKSDEPFDASSGSFTVAIRAKLIEPGSEKGNGDGNAMLWNVGNGWNDGARVVFAWDSSRFSFQIGANDVHPAAWSERGYFPGVTRDVVATFDGETKEMRLYVDGELAGAAMFDGELTTNDQPLNVGFGGSGVGSARMFVDRAETWTRALTADEIAKRQADRPAQERLAVAALRDVETSSNASVNLDVKPETLRSALALDLPSPVKERLRADLVANLSKRDLTVDRTLDATEYNEFAELVLHDVDLALAGEATTDENADASVSKEELERYARLVKELNRLLEISTSGGKVVRSLITSSSFDAAKTQTYRSKGRALIEKYGQNGARASSALKDLAALYPREAAAYAKIEKLENSAERVRRLERDALGIYLDLTSTSRNERNIRRVFVAPDGSDEKGNGSEAAPYATLARAFKDAEKNAGRKTAIEMKAGTYYSTAPARLENASNVSVRGPEKGAAKIVGSRQIDNFASLEESAETNETAAAALERIPEEARGKIFFADLKAAGVDDLGTLKNRGYGGGSDVVNPIPTFTFNGKAQTLARWPNDGDETLKFGEKVDNPKDAPEDSSTFRFDFDRVDGWKLDGDDDVWAFGLFEWEWAANFRRVLKIDRDAKTLTFDYKNGSGRFDYYFVNVFEELDAPGEYYVDRATGFLYFYPPKGFETVEAVNAANAEYDVYEGRFIELEGASDVVISKLTMSGGRETAVTMKDCKRCFVSECAIEQMGGSGVVMNGGEFCGVISSRLRSLGSCGIRTRGGDPETLKPCRHLIHNNYVSDFSRIDRVYAPAVSAYGCGVVVTNNLFCDSPHHALRTDGQDMYIARNEIHSVVYEYSDQSGIDIYCDPSYRGIVIERNLWRHIGSSFALCGQAGIRLDDSISGVIMKENVFYRSSGGAFGGIQIHGGKDNLVKDNAFVDCLQALSFSVWGGDRYEKFVKEKFPDHVESDFYQKTYPFFDEIFDHYDRNYVFDNLAINCGKFNRSGDAVDVFVGNSRRTATPDLKKLGATGADLTKTPTEFFYTNRKALKKWLTDVTGISLKDVGLKANWDDAGEDVSPKYIGGAGSEK